MPSQTGSIDLTAQVSANNNAKDYSDTVVDNLEIGGRNLIGRFNWSATTQAQGADYYTCSGNGTISSNNKDSTAWSLANCQWQLTLAAGTYQFTTEVLTPCETWGSANLKIVNSSGTELLATGSTVFNNGGILVKTLTLSAETTIGIKIKPGKNAICRFKLEKGTKATDWTPAPEDQESLVTSTRTWYATCDTAEATVAKAATTTDDGFELHEGVSVDVKFTKTNTGAVASLTLNVNNTGAKSIKTMYNNSLANLTHAGQLYAGLVVRFVYSGTYWIAATNYNSNDYDRKRINNAVRAAENITAYAICGRSGTGHKKLVSGLAIDLSYPIAYLGSANLSGQSYAVASGGTSTVFYTSIPTVNLQYTKASWTGTQYAMCYVKGTLSGTTFTVHSDVFTTTVPTSDDGFAYIPIGMMVSTYQVNFDCDNTVYAYRNGKFQKFDTVANYITADNSGIKIHMAGNPTTYQRQTSNSTTFYVGGKKRSQVGADGLHVYVDTTETEVAKFTASGAQVGSDSNFHVNINNDGFALTAGNIPYLLVEPTEIYSAASGYSYYGGTQLTYYFEGNSRTILSQLEDWLFSVDSESSIEMTTRDIDRESASIGDQVGFVATLSPDSGLSIDRVVKTDANAYETTSALRLNETLDFISEPIREEFIANLSASKITSGLFNDARIPSLNPSKINGTAVTFTAMAGIIQMFAGATPPTGWLVCDGSAISRTTYATLFAAIGTTWGSGDGSTTFNVPDLRGRMPMGAGTGSGLTARTLGNTLGTETHNHGGNSGEVTLSAAQSGLPAHTHAFTQPTVKVKYSKAVASGSATNHIDGSSSSSTAAPMEVSGGAVGAVTGGAKAASSAHKHTISSNANIPPAAVINFIICTGKTS